MTILSHKLEWNRTQDLRFVVLCGHYVSLLGSVWEPLACSANGACGLGFGLLHFVSMNSVQEILPALTVLNVLNTHTDPLGENLATDTLVHNDTNSTLRHVEDTTSLAMVSLMRHALLECSAAYRTWNYTIIEKEKNSP